MSRLSRGSRADQGALTLVALILGGMMLAFVGLVWDGGRGVASTELANRLAAEAGRTAVQCVNIPAYLLYGTSGIPSSDQAMMCALPYQKLVNADADTNGYTMKITDVSFTGTTKDTFDITVEVDQAAAFFPKAVFPGTYIGHATVKLTQGVTDAGG